MTPAVEIAEYLAGEGFGDIGETLFVGWEPPMPHEVVTVYDTGGPPPELIEEDLRRRTIQVRVRSRDYLGGMATQEEIRNTLAGPPGAIFGEHRYVGIWLTGDIMSVGRDENNRHILTANYEVLRHETEQLS